MNLPSNSNPTLIFGSDYTKPGDIRVFPFDDQIAAGLTAGKKHTVKQKKDGNEDAIGVVHFPGCGYLLLLADSHFGAFAANYALQHFETYFRASPGDLGQKLFTAHFRVDRALRHAKKDSVHHPGCSTTLVSLFITKDQYFFCNSGDSHAWRVTADDFKELFEIQEDIFIGDIASGFKRYLDMLYAEGLIDEMTELGQIERLLFRIAVLQKRVSHGNLPMDEVRGEMAVIEEILGCRLPLDAEALAQPWHPVYVEIQRCLPHFGQGRLLPGDRILMASDGIDLEVSGCDLMEIAKILRKGKDPQGTLKKALKACMGRRGGNDNIALLLYEKH